MKESKFIKFVGLPLTSKPLNLTLLIVAFTTTIYHVVNKTPMLNIAISMIAMLLLLIPILNQITETHKNGKN